MKKIKVLFYLLNSIFLTVFNFFFFLLKGSDKLPTTVWICYVSIHFAYLVFLAAPHFIRKGSASADYERPIFAITTTYFSLVFIISVILIILSTKNRIAELLTQFLTTKNKIAALLIEFLTKEDTMGSIVQYISPPSITLVLLIQIMITGISAILLLVNLIANEHTADSLANREVELKYVKEASSRLYSLLNQLSDKKLQRLIERAYDLIHSSQVRSSKEVKMIEQNVFNEISLLEGMIRNKDFDNIEMAVNKIFFLAEERNRQLKLLN